MEPKESGCTSIVKALIGGVATIIAAIIAYIVAPIAIPLISDALTPTPAAKAPPAVAPSPTLGAQRPTLTIAPTPASPLASPTRAPVQTSAPTQPAPAPTNTRAPQATATALPPTPSRLPVTATPAPATPTTALATPTRTLPTATTAAPTTCNAQPINPQDNVAVNLNNQTWYAIQDYNNQSTPPAYKFSAQLGGGAVTARVTNGQRAWACPNEAAAKADAESKAKALKAANPTYRVVGPDGKEMP